MNRIGVIISIVMLLSSMVSCKETRSKREILEDIYKDYSLVQFMREYAWFGMESVRGIDSSMIDYNHLGIDGWSFEEIKNIYGSPLGVRYDTLVHGISLSKGRPTILYPVVYRRDSVSIMNTRYFFEDNTILDLYFETKNDTSKVIFGYKINKELLY